MDIKEIEEYYSKIDFKGSIRLSKCETIVEPKKMVKSHISYLKGNPKNRRFLPYYDRLLKLIKILDNDL